MRITTYRPPYRDEFWYGWLLDLADTNMDSRYIATNVMKFTARYFPYSGVVLENGKFARQELWLDCIRGLSDNIRNLKEQGYVVPDTDDFIRYHTVLAVTGIAKPAGIQAKYMEAVIRVRTRDKWDLTATDAEVKSLKICPECVKEDLKDRTPYLRTWHQIQGVTVCAEHGIPLQTITRKEALSFIQGDLPMGEKVDKEAEKEEFSYACFIKEIYDRPSWMNLGILRQAVIPYEDEIDIGHFTGRRPHTFTKVAKELMKTFGSYVEILEMAREPAGREISKILYGIPDSIRINGTVSHVSEFSCSICGHTWEAHPYAVYKGFGCPVCDSGLSDEERINRLLLRVGDGKYELAEPYEHMGKRHKIFHRTCGRIINDTTTTLSERIWWEHRCACEKMTNMEELKEKVEKAGTGYVMTGYERKKINGHRRNVITIKHTCGQTRTVTDRVFFAFPYCRRCEPLRMDENNIDVWIERLLGDEYELYSYQSFRYLEIRHKPCGTVFDTNLYVLKNGKQCPLCASYYIAERDQGPTLESILYLQMKDYFKDHKVWSTRKHLTMKDKKPYFIALRKLEIQGYVKRVSTGYYALTDEVTVYDLLNEKYLTDRNGDPCGRYTGETHEYLTGKRDTEPEVLSLESGSLYQYSQTTVTVMGKKVLTRGLIPEKPKKLVENKKEKGEDGMLGTFFPPKEDEWMSAWAEELAKENLYKKIHQFYMRQMGYDFGNRENRGYLRNLDEICDRHGLDVFSVLRNNTDLYAFGMFYTYGTMADISDRLIRVPRDSFLMYCPKRHIGAWKWCPECAREDEERYGRKIVHTKHLLYGVRACWKHGCKLVTENSDESDRMATEEEIRYAKFLSDLFDEPLECSILEVQEAVLKKLSETGYQYAKDELPEGLGFTHLESVRLFFRGRFGHTPASFEKMAWLLVKLFSSAEELKKYLGFEGKDKLEQEFVDAVKDTEIIRTDFPFAKLQCQKCGQEFTVHMKAYLLGSWCPSCDIGMTEEDVLRRRISLIENDEYEYLGMVRGNAKIKVRHKPCGTVTKPTIQEFIWNYRGCLTCQQNMWKQRVGMKNRNKNGIEFTITAYRNANDMDVISDTGVKMEHVSYDAFAAGTLGGLLSREEMKTHKEHHLGETFVNNQGKCGKIVAWNGYDHIDVEFENGYIARNRQYEAFKAGAIRCEEPGFVRRKDRVGQKSKHLCGMEMEIIRYSSVHDMDVKFEDGYVAKHVSYRTFKNGSVRHPEHNHRLKTERIGEEFLQNNGCVAVVVEYRSERDCLIRFTDDGAEVDHVSIQRLKNGTVGKPFVPPLGKKYMLHTGEEVEIIAYNGIYDVTIRWPDGFVREGVRMSGLRRGLIAKK